MSLVCPACGAGHDEVERFCARCGLPLVVEGGPVEADVTEQHERFRKVKKQYAEGELVRVAVGRQLPEAELIQNLLLEEGVPSLLRRSRGFDVPDMLAAGPRDVLVPQSGEATAREVLLQAQLHDGESTRGPVPPGMVLAGLLCAVAVVALLVLLLDLTA